MQVIKKIKIQVSAVQIFLLLTALVAFLIPFNQHFTNLIIIFFLAAGFVYTGFNASAITLKNSWPYVLLILFYVIHVISLLQGISDSKFTDLEVKLSFLLIPILWIFIPQKNFNSRAWIQKSFIVSVILVFIICIITAFVHSNTSKGFNPRVMGGHNYFLYSLFSTFTHPSYNTMFTSLAMVFLLKFIADGVIKSKGLYIAIGFVLVFNAYLLSSRAGTYAFFAMLYFSVLAYFIWKRKLFNTLIYAVLVSALFVGFQKFNPRVIHFSKQVEKQVEIAKKEGLSKADVSNVNIRWAYWKVGVELVKPHLVNGVGVGNIKTLRMAEFKKKGYTNGIKKEHNFHNQFVETLVGTGMVGLLSLLSLFFAGLFVGIKKRDYVLLSFVIITGINFLFESMLMNAAGVIFFVFFYCLLFYQTLLQTKKAA